MRNAMLAVLVLAIVAGAGLMAQDAAPKLEPESLKDIECKSLVVRDTINRYETRMTGRTIVMANDKGREIRIDPDGITMTDANGNKAIQIDANHRRLTMYDEKSGDVAVLIDVGPNGVSIDAKSPKGSGLACRVQDFALTLRGQKAGGEVETLLPKK